MKETKITNCVIASESKTKGKEVRIQES